MKLETNNWKSYKIADLFNIKNTNCILNREIIPNSGEFPYVTASAINNGVQTCINFDINKIEKGNCILIGGKTMSITYQRDDFFSNDSHNLALYLKDEKHRTKEVQFYLIAVLKNILGKKYQWSDSISSKVIIEDEIELPSIDDQPDFSFMADYIIHRTKFVQNKLTQLLTYFTPPTHNNLIINTSTWQEFSVKQLFNVVKGTRLTKSNMTTGNIRFIGASQMNNGITTHIGNDTALHPSNTITVNYNGSVGASFYQDQPFWASDDVNVLYPKFTMTQQMAMFLIPIIMKKGKNYTFIDKWKKNEMEHDIILLPTTTNGTPDFAYMEKWINLRQNTILKKIKRISIQYNCL